MPALRYALKSATINAVARSALLSARTVRRYLGGLRLSYSSRTRIERALRARKLSQHIRAEGEA